MSALSRFRFGTLINNVNILKDSWKPNQSIIRKLSTGDDLMNNPPTKLENVDNFKCINRVTLLGRATSPAVGFSLGKNEMVSFTLATNELRRNRENEIVKRSEFHKIQVFIPRLVNKTKVVLQKGSRVLVEGKINYNVRKNEHGEFAHFTNIIAENIVFITGNRMNNQNQVDEVDDQVVEEILEEQATKQ